MLVSAGCFIDVIAICRLQSFVPYMSAMKVTEVALPEPDCQLVSSLTTDADTPRVVAMV